MTLDFCLQNNLSTDRTTAEIAKDQISDLPNNDDFKRKSSVPNIMETQSINKPFKETPGYEELIAYKADNPVVAYQKSNPHEKSVSDNSSQTRENWIMEILKTEFEKQEQLQPDGKEVIKSNGDQANLSHGNISKDPTTGRPSGLEADKTDALRSNGFETFTKKKDLLIPYNTVADEVRNDQSYCTRNWIVNFLCTLVRQVNVVHWFAV